MKRRVVVTGVGMVCPLGIGAETSWKALCEGKSGIGPITRFDPSGIKCHVAGQMNNFDPADFLDAKFARRFDGYIQYVMAASKMAMEDSGFKVTTENHDRIGVILGCATGGHNYFLNAYKAVAEGNLKEVPPFLIVNAATNLCAGVVAIQFDAKGPHHLVADACAAGTNAIGLAFRAIQHGEADAMITGGTESPISPSLVSSLDNLGALTSKRNDEPTKASRPFDGDRDGFVTGEGSGVIVLETMESALNRNAKIYGEIIGYGNNCDAFHYTSPDKQGTWPAKCISLALNDAGIKPEEVDYVNAHGTSTILNDLAETKAIKLAFGPHAYKLAISSNKSAIGHLWGAAGGVEAVFSLLTIRDGIMPPTLNLEVPDPECDLDYIPKIARKGNVNVVISNSFGFGGVNGTLVFRKFSEKN